MDGVSITCYRDLFGGSCGKSYHNRRSGYAVWRDKVSHEVCRFCGEVVVVSGKKRKQDRISYECPACASSRMYYERKNHLRRG